MLRDVSNALGSPEGISSKVVPEIVQQVFLLIVSGYEDWKSQGFPRYAEGEVPYTACLVGCMLNIARESGSALRPRTETVEFTPGMYIGIEDPAKAPRIDVTVGWGRVSDEAYLSVECKRLSLSDQLPKKYVMEGMTRFSSAKYTPQCPSAGMIGYVVADEPPAILAEINKTVSGFSQLGAKHSLKSRPPILTVNEVYESKHDRPSPFSPVHVTHFFLDLRARSPLPLSPAGRQSRRRSRRRGRSATASDGTHHQLSLPLGFIP